MILTIIDVKLVHKDNNAYKPTPQNAWITIKILCLSQSVIKKTNIMAIIEA